MAVTQSLGYEAAIFHIRGVAYAEKPKRDIYNFVGNFTYDKFATEQILKHGHVVVQGLSASSAASASSSSTPQSSSSSSSFPPLLPPSPSSLSTSTPSSYQYHKGKSRVSPALSSSTHMPPVSPFSLASPSSSTTANSHSNFPLPSPRSQSGQSTPRRLASVAAQPDLNRTQTEPLSADNMMWAETVVASGTCYGLVVYTGQESRAVMNTTSPRGKTGQLDMEVNHIAKLLFALLVLLSFIMTALKGFTGLWLIYFFRFVLLFSAIIPISLRVNLDLAKSFYSYVIMSDKKMPDTVVRNSTIPEELGRVHYLMSDKTGTLTQNDMIFKVCLLCAYRSLLLHFLGLDFFSIVLLKTAVTL